MIPPQSQNQAMPFSEAACELSGEPFELLEDVGDVVMLSHIRENLDRAALPKVGFEGGKAWKAV